jgi:NADPH2:quinone reductase
MRAVVCHSFDGMEALSFSHNTTPPNFNPSLEQAHVFGDVRIRVRAAGINFADTLMVQGKYQVKPLLPFTPGLEVAGEVIEVAPHVSRVRVGQRVMAFVAHGGYAEEAIAPEACVYAIPDTMDWVSAAGFPITYGTSCDALTRGDTLRKGDVLLVHGAAGGVGLTAVEIGKRLGATVIATAGGAEKLAIAAQYGADHLIDYRTEDTRKQVKALTAGRGADVVFDPVGGEVFAASLRAVAQGGQIIVIGFASGDIPQVPANIVMVKNITVTGYNFGGWRALDPDGVRASMETLLGWYAAGEIKPHASHIFPLEDYAQALETLKARKSTGKIVLTVD